MDDRDDTLKVTRFLGKKDDFALWAMRMEAVLEAKGLMGVVDGSALPPAANNLTAAQEYNNMKKKARALLINSLGDRPLRAVQKSKASPKEMWIRLHDRYATSSPASRIQLHMTLHSMKPKPHEDISDFIENFESIFARLAAMGHPVEETTQVAMLLASFNGIKE